MWKSDIMHGVYEAQDFFAEIAIFDAGLFCTTFYIFKAHSLPKEQKIFQYRTKSLGLNHLGISAVSHWFSFFKNSYWTSRPP
jgi:hypothetical protein